MGGSRLSPLCTRGVFSSPCVHGDIVSGPVLLGVSRLRSRGSFLHPDPVVCLFSGRLIRLGGRRRILLGRLLERSNHWFG